MEISKRDEILNKIYGEVAGEIIARFPEVDFKVDLVDEEGNVVGETVDLKFEKYPEIEEEFNKLVEEKMANTPDTLWGGGVNSGHANLGYYSFPQFAQAHGAAGVYDVWSSASGGSKIGAIYDKEIFIITGVNGSYSRNAQITFLSSGGSLKTGYINLNQWGSSTNVKPFCSKEHLLGVVHINGSYRPYWRVTEGMNLYNGSAQHVGSPIYTGRAIAGNYGATPGASNKHWVAICGYEQASGQWHSLGSTHFVNTGLLTRPSRPYVYGRPGK